MVVRSLLVHLNPLRLEMNHSTFSVLALTLGVASAACDSAGGDAGVVVRDSAGVRIAEHPGFDGPSWRLSDEPLLVLGTLEGDEAQQLYSAAYAIRRDDGTLIVANQGTQELRFFGPDGEHVRTVGGEGGGPGEFEAMLGLARFRGDSLGVWDRSAKRLTLYDRDGKLGRMVSIQSDRFSPRLLGPLDADHAGILTGLDAMAIFGGETGVRHDSATVLKVDIRTGAIVDTLGPYPGDQQYISVGEQMFWIKTVLFGREQLIGVGAGHIHAGDDRSGEVRSYDADGRLRAILRVGSGPGPVTDAAEQRYRARLLENVRDDRLAEERRRLAETPTAERFPVFDELFADHLGRIWIRAFDPELGETRRWTVFDEHGQAAGRLDLPERFRPLDAGPDYALFRTRDEFDVERLLLFALDPDPG